MVTPFNFENYRPKRRYSVDCVFKEDAGRVNVYNGNDHTRAVEVCNFWDERVDTYLTDHKEEWLRMTPLERAFAKFDALALHINNS